MIGEDATGSINGKHRSTGIGRPRFWDRARYFGEEKRLAAALDAAEVVDDGLRECAVMNMHPHRIVLPSGDGHRRFALGLRLYRSSGKRRPRARRAIGHKAGPSAGRSTRASSSAASRPTVR